MAESNDGTAGPLGEAFRLLQDVGGKLSDAARSLAEEVVDSPAGSFTEPMARMAAQLAELSTAWVSPVRSLLEEQQELIDTLAAWAEQQRLLAEQFSKLAERHKKLTDQTMGILGPVLEQVDLLGGRKP
jgi:hypothetical protein